MKAQVASLENIENNFGPTATKWNEIIEHLYSQYFELASKPDPARIERLIALTRRASGQIKTHNEVSLAQLHVLETTNPLLKEGIAEFDELNHERLELEILEKEIEEVGKALHENKQKAPPS